ncbi:polygalacturonase, partial [Trifolium medium]|nr:polygalacturonase [Trifolium medium]
MFFSGPCLTPGPVTIQVVGTVLATTDISEYENSEWLMFQHIEGLKLIGGGTFDGQGQSSWEHNQDCEADPTDQCVRSPSDCQNYDEQVNANMDSDSHVMSTYQNVCIQHD